MYFPFTTGEATSSETLLLKGRLFVPTCECLLQPIPDRTAAYCTRYHVTASRYGKNCSFFLRATGQKPLLTPRGVYLSKSFNSQSA